jgi:replicative DNA helicase
MKQSLYKYFHVMNFEIRNKIQNIIRNEETDEKDILVQLKHLIYETELLIHSSSDSKTIIELVADNLSFLKGSSSLSHAIKTGFSEFDELFGGFIPGEFVVIGGRPSMGKTQLLVNLALHISKSNPVLYFTFDLSEFLLTARFISSLSKIPVSTILQNELSDEHRQTLSSIEPEFSKHKILINDGFNQSIHALKTHCRNQIEKNGIQVIMIDYLQMMGSNKYRNNRELEISFISRELKTMAKELNVCVIATSQLSRAVETRGGDRHPQLSDLRESGAIEQDADKVIFIYRPEYYGMECDEFGNSTSGLTKLILAKNRNGSLGSVKLKRDRAFTNFHDFENYKNDFTFSESRLNEISSNNSSIKKMIDRFGLESPPF